MHAFILGIAVTEADADAAPLVVWEGSHHLIRAAFAEAFDGVPPEDVVGIDMTGAYHGGPARGLRAAPGARFRCDPGQAVLVHRHAIHGVAPWREGARAAEDGRAIVYFRPEVARPEDWLNLT
jgi:hypothetical protein